jgi:predicted oxidoreductase
MLNNMLIHSPASLELSRGSVSQAIYKLEMEGRARIIGIVRNQRCCNGGLKREYGNVV